LFTSVDVRPVVGAILENIIGQSAEDIINNISKLTSGQNVGAIISLIIALATST
jgi:patatin-like phospholipase/acyl hydrolase